MKLLVFKLVGSYSKTRIKLKVALTSGVFRPHNYYAKKNYKFDYFM